MSGKGESALKCCKCDDNTLDPGAYTMFRTTFEERKYYCYNCLKDHIENGLDEGLTYKVEWGDTWTNKQKNIIKKLAREWEVHL